jgi:hypothetical protein
MQRCGTHCPFLTNGKVSIAWRHLHHITIANDLFGGLHNRNVLWQQAVKTPLFYPCTFVKNATKLLDLFLGNGGTASKGCNW